MPAPTIPLALPLQELPHINLNNTLGAVYIGAFLHAILYGILCLQCYIFFSLFAKDRKLLKLSVAVLWILNSLHLATIIYLLYHFLITNFGKLKHNTPWSIGASVLVTVLSDTIVRGWFTHRVWILGRSWPVVSILFMLVMLSTASGLWLSVQNFMAPSIETFNAVNWLCYFNLAVSIASDIYVAVLLCFYLQRQKNPVNKRTNSLLNFLMAYAVNTGLLTAMVSVACMITYGTIVNKYVFLSIYFMIGPLYVNALLGSLNARDWFREDSKGPVTISLRTFNFATPVTASQSSASVDASTAEETHCKPSGEPEIVA